MRNEILRLENINKFDAGVNTLRSFSMNIFNGEVLGLFSRSVSDKESLIEILCGAAEPNRGKIYFDDQIMENGKYQNAIRNRVFVVGGKSKLCRNLTVADNIFLIRERCKQYIINDKVIFNQTAELFKRFDLSIDPRKDAIELSPMERCAAELVKACATGQREYKLIILKDLSNYLNITEMNCINTIVNTIKEAGNSVLYMDNDLELLMRMCDRITVMRDGRNARTFRKEDYKTADLMAVFMGGNVAAEEESQSPQIGDHTVISFNKVSSNKIKDLTVSINKGEVVSFFDPYGRGEEEVIGLLEGSKEPLSGEIYYKGELYQPSGDLPLENGIGFIKEDALEATMFRRWSVLDNLSFLAINKYRGRILGSRRFNKSIVQEYYSKFGESIYAQSLKKVDTPTLYKILYYKWHLFAPKLLVCVKPFAGLDLYLKQLVTEMIWEIAEKGAAVIVVSSNVNEARTLGNRIVVINENSSQIALSTGELLGTLAEIATK